ncbi:MAG TPA: hypothetical protein VM452_13315 [Caulifigura sp.]|jgi:hypothetical protein|nr:hypothetical protein [Caulifigura sp.]
MDARSAYRFKRSSHPQLGNQVQVNRNLNFDTGIEQILVQNDPRRTALPETGRTLPGDGQITHLLDQVLSPPSVEQSLMESFRPEITERDLLSPAGYESAREQAGPALQGALSSLPDSNDRQSVEQALQLLADDKSLRDLLNTYRNLLHRA